MTCQTVSALTGEDGSFSIGGGCLGDTTYTLSTDNNELWLGDISSVPQGGFEGAQTIKAWRVPVGTGIYSLQGETLTTIRSATDIKTEQLLGSDPPQEVMYPDEIKPSKVGLVGPGGYLVLASKEMCDNVKLYPLIEDKILDKPEGDEQRRLFEVVTKPSGDKVIPKMNPWWYLGYRFASDTEWEKVDANVDMSKVIRQESASHAACFYPHGVVSSGRYALVKDGQKRLYIVDFK